MENKGKKRRDKMFGLFISVAGGKRDWFSKSCIENNISAKFLEQTGRQHSIWLVELQPLEMCLCQKYIDLSLKKKKQTA